MTYPTYDFDPTQIKYRFGERYTSEASNRKFLGVPLGVYLGFLPSFSNQILTLATDPTYGYCFARLASQDDPLYIVDVVVSDDVVLDFSNHNAYPVNVVLRVSGRLGFPHSAEIVTQAPAPVYPTEILLGVVTGPNTIDVSEPFNRDTPYAYSGASLGYGFMRDGAVEELLASIAMNAEVIAARVDLSGVTQSDLDTRLETDASGSSMALRLGKEIRTILADDFVVAAPTDSISVSRAFSRYHRSLSGNAPIQDFDGFASESRLGAITSGVVPDPAPTGALTDTERNVCAVIDATSEARLTDSTRQVAYGRLVFDELALTGTEIVFNSGSTTVTGVGTAFMTLASGASRNEVVAGDIIQDPISGDYFEVAVVTSDTQLDLSVSFPNATTPASTAPTLRRSFTLNCRTRTGVTTETPYSVPAGMIRVYFNAWVTLENSQFDYLTDLFRNFEEAPVTTATTSTAGKAFVTSAIPEGQAGAVYAIQAIGTQVGPPHVSSVDFGSAALASPGVVNVTQRGPTGLPGNPGSGGSPGPTGPQGAQGQGFTNFSAANLFDESNVFDHSLLGAGTAYSYTTSMVGTEVLFLTGGNSEWYSPFVFDSNDHFDITDISVVGGTNVRLDARVPLGAGPAAQVRFFFNAATTP